MYLKEASFEDLMLLYPLLLLLFSITISSSFSNNSLQALFEEYFRWKLRTYPEWATKIGFNDYNGRTEDFRLGSIEKRVTSCDYFMRKSRAETPDNEELRTYQAIMEVRTLFIHIPLMGFFF